MAAIEDDQVGPASDLVVSVEETELSEGNKWQTAGSGWINYAEEMSTRFKDWRLDNSEELLYPLAIDLLTIADRQYNDKNLLDPADALPVYVRDQVVRVAK